MHFQLGISGVLLLVHPCPGNAHLSRSWDSTKKHRNFCPQRSVEMNTLDAWEFFSLEKRHKGQVRTCFALETLLNHSESLNGEGKLLQELSSLQESKVLREQHFPKKSGSASP